MIRLKTLAAAAIAVSLLPSGGAFAQDPADEGQSVSASAVQSPALGNIDIDFPGGTLREYFRHLQDQAGVNNIVIQYEEIDKIEMPRVKLSGVHFADAITLVPSLIDRSNHPNLRITPVGMNRSIYVAYSERREQLSPSENSIQTPITVDFQGGSLADFVRHLQKESGARNILLRGPSDRFEIKPVEFKAVTPMSILTAFSGAEQVLQSGERMRLNVENRAGILLVEVLPDTRMVHQQQNPMRTASWSLASMRGHGRLTSDQILTAIEAAVEVSGGGDSTNLRFHEETSLLIVSGGSDTLQTITSVLGQLQQSSDEAARQHQRIQEKHYEYKALQAREIQLMRAVDRINDSIQTIDESLDLNRKASLPLLEQELRTTEGRLDFVREEMAIVLDQLKELRGS
jgi:hypothetical protein